MTLPDRMFFARGLGEALAAPEPVQGVTELLHRVLITEPVVWESDEQRLVRGITERLDTASGDPDRFLALARDVEHLLDHASSNEGVELLLELIAERQRVLGVMHKFAEGTISRTGFLSFIEEQRWPNILRRRMAALSEPDLATVIEALEQSDIAELEAILTT